MSRENDHVLDLGHVLSSWTKKKKSAQRGLLSLSGCDVATPAGQVRLGCATPARPPARLPCAMGDKT